MDFQKAPNFKRLKVSATNGVCLLCRFCVRAIDEHTRTLHAYVFCKIGAVNLNTWRSTINTCTKLHYMYKLDAAKPQSAARKGFQRAFDRVFLSLFPVAAYAFGGAAAR